MKNTTLTLIFGSIALASTFAALSMDYISKEVMSGAAVAIVLPCLLFFFYFKFVEENKKELAAKSLAKAAADDHLALNDYKITAQKELAPFSTQTGRKERVESVIVSV